MSSKSAPNSMLRLSALRKLLTEDKISTQDELAEELRAQDFIVTQSTISRDLSRLGAIKTRDTGGRIVYRLLQTPPPASSLQHSDFSGLLVNVEENGSIIVIHTTPGSASLVARQLDQTKPAGLLGTIAGDDTIFVAPCSSKKIAETIRAIFKEFS
jgi:transcriptional regulator of arginine metabolism